jgi:hypothetical protein
MSRPLSWVPLKRGPFRPYQPPVRRRRVRLSWRTVLIIFAGLVTILIAVVVYDNRHRKDHFSRVDNFSAASCPGWIEGGNQYTTSPYARWRCGQGELDILNLQNDLQAPMKSLPFPGARLAVAVRATELARSSPGRGFYGVACWYFLGSNSGNFFLEQPPAGYLLSIGPMGGYKIESFGGSTFAQGAIPQLKSVGKSVRIRGLCERHNKGTLLTLFVNGQRVAAATDSTAFSPFLAYGVTVSPAGDSTEVTFAHLVATEDR